MIYHGLFGMDFTEQGLRFAPVVPEGFDQLSLDNVQYRQARLHIQIRGHGIRVREFMLDGKATKFLVPVSLAGPHEIEIVMR